MPLAAAELEWVESGRRISGLKNKCKSDSPWIEAAGAVPAACPSRALSTSFGARKSIVSKELGRCRIPVHLQDLEIPCQALVARRSTTGSHWRAVRRLLGNRGCVCRSKPILGEFERSPHLLHDDVPVRQSSLHEFSKVRFTGSLWRLEPPHAGGIEREAM